MRHALHPSMTTPNPSQRDGIVNESRYQHVYTARRPRVDPVTRKKRRLREGKLRNRNSLIHRRPAVCAWANSAGAQSAALSCPRRMVIRSGARPPLLTIANSGCASPATCEGGPSSLPGAPGKPSACSPGLTAPTPPCGQDNSARVRLPNPEVQAEVLNLALRCTSRALKAKRACIPAGPFLLVGGTGIEPVTLAV